MKKFIKSALALSATFAVIGAGLAPLAVSAWGDNAGGRKSYTKAEINNQILGNKIVFNSISDSAIGDEKNFVGARLDDGNHGSANQWQGNQIEVESGKTYIIRLYVHNNNPKGESAIATNVRAGFLIPSTIGKTAEINGKIFADNATPSIYWDNVKLTSKENFKLEYIKGSARLENNGIGKKAGGLELKDEIINDGGTLIGYNKLDGKIPGCFEYASYLTIKVKVNSEETSGMIVEKKVRFAGTKEWKMNPMVKIGDKLEYQIHYKNISGVDTNNVMVQDSLPDNMELIKGTTKLFNTANKNGIARDDTVTTTGVNIGGYSHNGDAYLRFQVEVKDKNLACGNNKLVNWAKVTAAGKVKLASADVYLTKTCAQPQPQPQPKKEIPKTGPTDFIMGLIGAVSLTIASGYYLISRKNLQ